MSHQDLSHMEPANLTNNLRTIREALDKLAEVEAGLIAGETIEQINEAYRTLEAELKRRGYSDEEIADVS